MKWLAGYPYFYVLGSYSSHINYPLDPSKPEHTTTLTFAFGVFACCPMPSGSCNTPAIENLTEDCKLSACGRQPIVTISFCCHLIWFSYFVFVVIVFFRKSVYHSSLGEHSPTLHPTYGTNLVLYPDTLGRMHFSLGVG